MVISIIRRILHHQFIFFPWRNWPGNGSTEELSHICLSQPSSRPSHKPLFTLPNPCTPISREPLETVGLPAHQVRWHRIRCSDWGIVQPSAPPPAIHPLSRMARLAWASAAVASHGPMAFVDQATQQQWLFFFTLTPSLLPLLSSLLHQEMLLHLTPSSLPSSIVSS